MKLITKLENGIKKDEAKIKELKNKIKILEKEKSKTEDVYDKLEEKIKNMENRIDDLEEAIEDYEHKIEEAEYDIEDLIGDGLDMEDINKCKTHEGKVKKALDQLSVSYHMKSGKVIAHEFLDGEDLKKIKDLKFPMQVKEEITTWTKKYNKTDYSSHTRKVHVFIFTKPKSKKK